MSEAYGYILLWWAWAYLFLCTFVLDSKYCVHNGYSPLTDSSGICHLSALQASPVTGYYGAFVKRTSDSWTVGTWANSYVEKRWCATRLYNLWTGIVVPYYTLRLCGNKKSQRSEIEWVPTPLKGEMVQYLVCSARHAGLGHRRWRHRWAISSYPITNLTCFFLFNLYHHQCHPILKTCTKSLLQVTFKSSSLLTSTVFPC
jgi:hypothetical protein